MDSSRLHALVVIGFCIVAVLVFELCYYRFDERVVPATDRMAMTLYDRDATRWLTNGSGVNNIPTLNLIGANPDVVVANNCGKGPVYIGAAGKDADCVRTCADAAAKAVHVLDGETFTYESAVLRPGVHCVLGVRPNCNMKTARAVMTVNSVVCQTRFPRLFGGPTGGEVVACNDGHINDPQNVLWDYAENRRVDPWRSVVLDEDERTEDGRYRYRCKFNGSDVRGNRYTEHPHDRFHPIANYCADLVYGAHASVRTVVDDARQSFTCDCGDAAVTRLTNLVPGDPSSQCSDVSFRVTQDVKRRKRITVPYKCVSLYSPLADVGRYHVCPEERLTREGSQMASVELEFTEDETQLIEHPLYRDFVHPAAGVFTPIGLKLNIP